jgi:uncharacterized damage-inducible protein DinB
MSEPTLVELLHGKGAHASPIACVEDLSSALAGRTIDGFPHSIWQLLRHMNYWMEFEIQRIDGHPPQYPEHAAGSWLAGAKPPSDAAWTSAVARFRELIDTLVRHAQSGPEVLAREVPPAHAQQGGVSSSVRAILWQVVAHNAYHIGQVAVIRRCLNAWPPSSGGDTW